MKDNSHAPPPSRTYAAQPLPVRFRAFDATGQNPWSACVSPSSLRAADAAAFDGSASLLAASIREVAEKAFPLEAQRLFERYQRTVERFPSIRDRVMVLDSLLHLARRTRLQFLAS